MIYRLVLGWAKADSDSRAFADAWGILLNALAGAWGTVAYQIIEGYEVEARVTKGYFVASLDATLEAGTYTISIPYVCLGYARISVESVTAGEATKLGEYIVEEGATSAAVTIPEGRMIITAQGQARRI